MPLLTRTFIVFEGAGLKGKGSRLLALLAIPFGEGSMVLLPPGKLSPPEPYSERRNVRYAHAI